MSRQLEDRMWLTVTMYLSAECESTLCGPLPSEFSGKNVRLYAFFGKKTITTCGQKPAPGRGIYPPKVNDTNFPSPISILLPLLPFPSPSICSFSVSSPFHFPFPIPLPQIQLEGLGEHCKLLLLRLGLGQNPVRKRILTHLRVSKRTSWQHLSASPTQHFLWHKMCHYPLGLDAPLV